MKTIDISIIYSLPAEPHSIRLPPRLMRLIKEDAKNNGRKLSTHISAIFVKYLNEVYNKETGQDL
jgi:predicted DNA-binding protein